MSLTVQPLTSSRDFKDFIKFPYKLHKHHANWVAPLISEVKEILSKEKNPFYQHSEIELFLAKREGKVVGRIAAVRDQNYIDVVKTNVGQFGFFECIDDKEAAVLLFDAAANWLKDKGMEKMLGPTNPSMNDELGVLVDAFDIPPAIKMVWNPPYYMDLFDSNGFDKAMDLLAWELHKDKISDRVKRLGKAILKRSKVTFRHPDMKNFDHEIEVFRDVYNRAWSENWGFVPWTAAEFDHLAKGLKQIIDPNLALIAEIDGEAVGFSLALPDLNVALGKINGRLFPFGLFKLLWHARKINRARIVILGVIKEYRNRGIDTALYYETFRIGTEKGYVSGEASWVLENNEPMNKALEMMGARPYKTYRLYERAL